MYAGRAMKRGFRLAALAATGSVAGAGALAAPARADDSAAATETRVPAPPPAGHAYLQYGVALAAETVVSSGAICSRVDNCIFGSGGGLAVRVGWRPDD